MVKKHFRVALYLILILSFSTLSILTPIHLNASTPVQVIGTIYKDAVTNLMDIGIISKSSSFSPDSKVTRAQMSQILVRMFNLDHPSTLKKSATKFKDVSSKYWASGYINIVNTKGIMKGFSKDIFSPEIKVTYARAVTYLLKTLCYGSKQVGNKKWPSNYLSMADDLGLLNDIEWKKYSDPCTLGNIAVLVWNTMNVNCHSKSSTLLESNYSSYALAHRKEKSIEEIAKNAESTVFVRTYNSPERTQEVASGSGVVFSNGMILTNAHVVDVAPRFGIVYDKNTGKDEYDTSGVLFYDSDIDLAILSSPNTSVKPVKLGDSSKVKVGQKIVTISSPEGIDYKNTVSEGIISGLRNYDGHNYIQITAAVSHGSSGGALYNMYGELIGIITLKDFDGESLNLAIPINDVKSALTNASEYDLNLNKAISDEMDSLIYYRQKFDFSSEASYDENNDEYVVNYYLYDKSEGAEKFVNFYTTNTLFKSYINTRLDAVQNMLREKGYENYIINLTVKDHNYIFRVRDGKTEVIKDTINQNMPDPVSYNDYAESLLKGNFASTDINDSNIKLESVTIGESEENTNNLNVNLFISEKNYNEIVDLSKDPKYEEEFVNWIELLSSEISKQYPNKNIAAYVTSFIGSYDKYSESYDTPPYFSNLNATNNNWDVYKDLFYYRKSIINNVSFEWLNEHTNLND